MWDEPYGLLNRFDGRLADVGRVGLTLWTHALRAMLDRQRQRHEKVTNQLILLETEVEAGASKARVMERLGKIRGMLTVICFGLIVSGLMSGEPMVRPRGSEAPVRVVRREF
jgi:hypothetical protein